MGVTIDGVDVGVVPMAILFELPTEGRRVLGPVGAAALGRRGGEGHQWVRAETAEAT